MEAKIFHLTKKVFDAASEEELVAIVDQVSDEFDGTFYEGEFDFPENWEDEDFDVLQELIAEELKGDLELLELDPEKLDVGVGYNEDESKISVAAFYDAVGEGDEIPAEGQGSNADSLKDAETWELPSKKLNPAVIYKRMKQDAMSYEVKVDTASEAAILAKKVVALAKKDFADKDFVVDYNKKFKILSLYEKQPDAEPAKV